MTDARIRLYESLDSKPYFYIKNQLVKLRERHAATQKTVARQSAKIQRMKERIATLESLVAILKG